MKCKTGLIIFLLLLPITTVSVGAQDQLQVLSWELGWDEDMDGIHTLELVNGDDIEDELIIFIDNQRMSDLNIELTIEWDSSDIPIDLDYQESITISGSTNETISIMLKNENGYVYDRSPNSTMMISVTADEMTLEQSTSNQNIEADIAVPEVYDLVVGATSRGEKLFAGSFIEYDFNIENMGNSDDAVDNPMVSIRSCPHLDVEAFDEIDGQVIAVGQNFQTKLKLTASSAHPDRTCEVTLSIDSSGNQLTSSVIIEIEVAAIDGTTDDSNQNNNDNSQSDDESIELTESSSLPFLSFVEFISIIFVINLILLRRK
ncbi:MAG: hypothetical protein QF479_00640 [Candidatus Poseidoniaceae archaeon]|nr:hypothetical protein [Candidatus Poseidoniaceae archaeon]